MARNITATETTTASNQANHFINYYMINGNTKLVPFLIIDKDPALVAKCQADSDFANRMFGSKHLKAVYNQRGVSNKPSVSYDDI